MRDGTTRNCYCSFANISFRFILARLSYAAKRLTPHMPTEVADTEEFLKVSERVTECRVKRLKDIVRLKLRTPRQLYTIRVDPEKAAELLKQIRCEVIEA